MKYRYTITELEKLTGLTSDFILTFARLIGVYGNPQFYQYEQVCQMFPDLFIKKVYFETLIFESKLNFNSFDTL